MGKGVSSSEVVTRQAEYIEDAHKILIDNAATYRMAIISDSPYAGYEALSDDVESAFFGSGYVISDFPSLYDMYGKFLAGLDIEVLFDEIFAESTEGDIVSDLISSHASKLSDDIEQEILPRYATGMRDINSVLSSSYMVGKAILENQRLKKVAEFDAETRYRMIPVAVTRWQAHLTWNQNVITTYVEILKTYLVEKVNVDNQDMEVTRKDTMWPFDVLDREANEIALFRGGGYGTATQQTPLWRTILGTALTIASYYYGGAAGAVVGSAVGGQAMSTAEAMSAAGR